MSNGSGYSYFSDDTIIAIATSLASDAGVGIIRISGKRAVEVAKKLDPNFNQDPPRTLNRIVIRRNNEILDDGLSVYFRAGASFTGEEVVELQLHGGRHVLQSVLQEAIATGLCRLALAGEFSFRAVRNGKLSLSGAKALQQIISAKSDLEVKVARNTLSSDRLQEMKEIGARVTDMLARVELSIDFIDQDVEVTTTEALLINAQELSEKVCHILKKIEAAKRVAQGFSVVLYGAPNAGKSTLFNALLAEDRAIVSPIAGTTRDIITEEILVGPYRIRLADTAGVREATEAIEASGVARAYDLVEQADVVVAVFDGPHCLNEVDLFTSNLQQLKQFKNKVVVINKLDQLSAIDLSTLKGLLPNDQAVVFLNALSGSGVGDLLREINNLLNHSLGDLQGSFLATEFQLSMLVQFQRSMAAVRDLLKTRGLRDPELVSSELRGAAQSLSQLLGETTPDTVLTKIFSEFCIGK